jgi:hypothetical protein
MRPKNVIIVLASIVIVGFAVFGVLYLQRSAERRRGASAPHTATRELANAARSLVRDLASRDPSGLPATTKQLLELVPMGTSLETARQIMTKHQFICSIDAYTNPAQMSNSAIWYVPFVKDGQRLAITNVARLKCETNGCSVTFWLVNGETTSLSVKGQF